MEKNVLLARGWRVSVPSYARTSQSRHTKERFTFTHSRYSINIEFRSQSGGFLSSLSWSYDKCLSALTYCRDSMGIFSTNQKKMTPEEACEILGIKEIEKINKKLIEESFNQNKISLEKRKKFLTVTYQVSMIDNLIHLNKKAKDTLLKSHS